MDPWSFQINRLNFEQLPPPLDYRAQQKNEQDAEQRGEQKIEGSIALFAQELFSKNQNNSINSSLKSQQFPLDIQSMAALQRADLSDRDACGALAPDKERHERDGSVMQTESGRQRELLSNVGHL